ncbi:MAG: DUF349 domain-containing protein [Bacteroidales bacterium]|nr:DUF349 domain-containing protein [Bacteroidales bacterium]
MEPKDLTNQTPEQENTPEMEKNTESSEIENQESLNEPSGDLMEAETSTVPETDKTQQTAEEALTENSPPEAEQAAASADDVEEEMPVVDETIDETGSEPEASEIADNIPASSPETEAAEEEETGETSTEESVAISEDIEAVEEEAPVSEPVEELVSAEKVEEPVEKTESGELEEKPVSETDEVPEIVDKEEEQDSEKVEVPESAELAAETASEKVEVPENTDEVGTPEEAVAEKEETVVQQKKEDHQDDHDEDEEEEEESEENYQNLSREELVELLEEAVQQLDIQTIKVKVALIKVAYLHKEKEEQADHYKRFLIDGGIQEEYSPALDQLSERYQMAFNVYREKKQRFNEEFEREKLVNLEAKKRILEELKALISSEETLKKTYDEFKNLQEEWKHTGMVPKSEINQLWQNYHFLVEKFFDKVKINKELKDLDLRKNLERKIELCEKTEELLIESSIIKSFKQLQQYHEEWKEVGPVPQDKKDEIWERFKIASDQINERRREYYNSKQGELESNYLAKSALCEKAEKVVSQNPETLKQWQNRTSDINDLLRVWKTIGPAPKKVNNEVWNRFKTSLDSHFTSYKEFLDTLKDQQLNNYNLKLDLCAQAESLKNSTDWRNTSQDLIQLQREWKSIGPVPRKHSDKIWKRFRSACDEFFKNKSEFFSSISQVEDDNLNKKEELIKKLQEFEFTANRSENLETLKNFQREWLEIGHVPIKEKDRLQNEFRNVLNKHFDKLKINASEVNAINYKNRLDSIKDTPDAGRVIYRERNTLQIKISKLQEDIMLWENNIGFLAESKNANIVKVEFQKKIDLAKQEVALMEAKLRYLREM